MARAVRAGAALVTGIALAAAAWGAAQAAPGDGSEDPNLAQSVTADEASAAGPASIAIGHADVGPRLVDGAWSVQVRDDSGSAPVWRDPNETVLVVTDDALLDAPTDEAYSFMGATEGERWYVIPQTQNPRVVWLGWNTQDPGVTSLIDRGATMTIGPVTGPGKSWMFLHHGTFGEPLLLVDGQKSEAQGVWVDVNTHVHANWVFTEPGVYTAALTMSADTVDGSTVSASTTLRFAVGSSTSVDEALTAPVADHGAGTAQEQSAHETHNADAASPSSEPATAPAWMWGAGIAALVIICALIIVIVVMARRSAAERSQAIEEARALGGAESTRPSPIPSEDA